MPFRRALAGAICGLLLYAINYNTAVRIEKGAAQELASLQMEFREYKRRGFWRGNVSANIYWLTEATLKEGEICEVQNEVDFFSAAKYNPAKMANVFVRLYDDPDLKRRCFVPHYPHAHESD